MINKICIITPGYPSEAKPYAYTFVDQLACAIADRGMKVSVIVPYDMLKEKKIGIYQWERETPHNHNIHVISPGALTLTTRKYGPFNFSLLSEKLFDHSVKRAIKKERIIPDLFYSHFLFPAGTCAAYLGSINQIPSVCTFGESSLWSIREIGLNGARTRLMKLSGVIAVSTNNKNVLIKNQLVEQEKIIVIPNACNKDIFRPGDKNEAREKLGLPKNTIIGIYNGAFTNAKGSLRVNEAAQKIDGLSMIYLGGGRDVPQGPNILYKGRVAHGDVATWLQAADFFVLPTLEEGCCNAIIEAMSVGLPIITSDRPFNYDILDHESGFLVDPLDIKAIHEAMQQLTNSEALRKEYGEASILKSANLDIEDRADRIIDYLNKVVENYRKG